MEVQVNPILYPKTCSYIYICFNEDNTFHLYHVAFMTMQICWKKIKRLVKSGKYKILRLAENLFIIQFLLLPTKITSCGSAINEMQVM